MEDIFHEKLTNGGHFPRKATRKLIEGLFFTNITNGGHFLHQATKGHFSHKAYT